MIDISKDSFESEVLHIQELVLVDYWSPRCGPCKEMFPDLLELADKYKNRVKFCKLNIAENRRLAISQKVLGVPTVLIYKDGIKVAELNNSFSVNDVECKLVELTTVKEEE